MDGWRRLSREWLQKEYPQCTFKEVHAAIGGTGSSLGVFRFNHDALQYKPDLLFVEFATNDGGAQPESIWANRDGDRPPLKSGRGQTTPQIGDRLPPVAA